MELTLTLQSPGIGNVRNRFTLHRIYAMNFSGTITEIGWEPGSENRIRIDANNIEFNVKNVWIRDLKTGKLLKTLNACCIAGIEIADPTFNLYPLAHCIGSVWCSECTLSEEGDAFSFESDVSRNLWLYVKDAIIENESYSHERYIEEIECTAYESFIRSAPSHDPHRDDLRILSALAKHYPPITAKKTGAQS